MRWPTLGGMNTRRMRIGLACLPLLAGCALYQNVAIETQPAGAEIYVDGKSLGLTPLSLPIDRVVDHSVLLKKDGFRPEMVVLTLYPMSDGIDYLAPADVRVQLNPLPGNSDRTLDIEIEK